MTETIELSNGLLHVLLNGTADAVLPLSEKQMQSLAWALHRVRWQSGIRWSTEMTPADLEVVHSIILKWAPTAPPAQVARYSNWLCRQSPAYHRLHAEHNMRKAT